MVSDNLHEQTREKNYCEKHDLTHVKNAVGQFVCPFCEVDDSQNASSITGVSRGETPEADVGGDNDRD